MKPFITIFTPTYNRRDQLERLYKSILSQKTDILEWLIIDDGSTDNTQEFAEKIISDRKFTIRYIKKSNGGKHTAYNTALKNANGILFFCVDSDDVLSDFAIEKLHSFWISKNKTDRCCGVIAKKRDIDGHYKMDDLPENAGEVTLQEMREKYKCKGDKCFIFITSIAKKYLFPEIDGEKFITESYIYDKIGLKYSFLTMNMVLNECEYLNDGYTHNLFKIMLNNPTGYKLFYMQRINMQFTLKKRIGYIIRYHAFRCMSSDTRYNYTGKYAVLVTLLRFTGLIGKEYYIIRAKLKK